MARCSLHVVVFSRLTFPLCEPIDRQLRLSVTAATEIYQPSGRAGGPRSGPSWFVGVGGRVMPIDVLLWGVNINTRESVLLRFVIEMVVCGCVLKPKGPEEMA